MSPRPNRHIANHTETAAKLRANPGQWQPVNVYRARTTAAGIAYGIREGRGQLAAYSPAGAFEAELETVEDGTLVRARYVGNAVEQGDSTPQPAEPKFCAPCRRGACEDCHAVDHPNMPNLYGCPCQTGQRCPRPATYGTDEIGGGHDFGIPGSDD